MLKKKLNKKVYFLLNFFEKGCQQQQQLNTHFFFQKETTESWFQQQMRKFFSFCFLSCLKKGFQEANCFGFLFEQKHCEVWSKNKGNKKETRRIRKSLLLLLSKNCFASKKTTRLLTLLGKWQKQSFFVHSFFPFKLFLFFCFFATYVRDAVEIAPYS